MAIILLSPGYQGSVVDLLMDPQSGSQFTNATPACSNEGIQLFEVYKQVSKVISSHPSKY